MAAVYRASQPSLSRQVAIKVLPEFFAEDVALRERFRQEARSIARLRHSNILTVYDSGEAVTNYFNQVTFVRLRVQ